MADNLKSAFVSESISKLYLQDELSDVKFAFEENGNTQFLPAHKYILASGSTVFHTMFYGSLPEEKVVNIVDADYEEFKEFLQFFYLSEVNLTMENIENVAGLTHKYDMAGCLETCISFLKTQLTNGNVFSGFELAVSLDIPELKQFCVEIINASSQDTLKSRTFLKCRRSTLKSFLQTEKLTCEETDVFAACMDWAKESCRKNDLSVEDAKILKEQLGDCFYLIRFGAMTKYQIGRIVDDELYAEMFTRGELLELLRTNSANNSPKNFIQISRSYSSYLSSHKKTSLILDRRTVNEFYELRTTYDDIFKANFPLMLCGLDCFPVHDAIREEILVVFRCVITDLETGNILFSGCVETSSKQPNRTRTTVSLMPHKFYKISFELHPTFHNQTLWRKRADLKSKYFLESDVEITFYRQNYVGQVKALYFKRV